MTAARVEPVDARTARDETLLAIHRVEEACADDLAPGEPWRSAAEALGYMRNPPSDERRHWWLARLDDEAVGMAALYVHGSSPLGWVHLRVLPRFRRRGVGRLLFAAVAEEARRHGLASLGAHHSTPDGAEFAAAAGAKDAQRDVRSVLRLKEAELPPPTVPSGYALRSWVGAAPDELARSFAAARNAVDDAPQPEGQELPPWTVQRLRDVEQAVARRNRDIRVTVATTDGGDVAAFTEIRVSAPPSLTASTEDTATVAAHRRRGLSLAVKVESLRLLRADRSDVEVVPTLNAESNSAMRAVNTKLGFVPIATLTTAVLQL